MVLNRWLVELKPEDVLDEMNVVDWNDKEVVE